MKSVLTANTFPNGIRILETSNSTKTYSTMRVKTYCVKYGKDYRGIRYATLEYGDEHENGHTYSRNFINKDELKEVIEGLKKDGYTSL